MVCRKSGNHCLIEPRNRRNDHCIDGIWTKPFGCEHIGCNDALSGGDMRATVAALVAVGLGAFAFGFWSEERFAAFEGFVLQPIPVAVLSLLLLSVVLRSYRSNSSL